MSLPIAPATAPPTSLVGRTRRAVRVYLALLGAAWRSEAQYRGNVFIMALGGLALQCTGFAFIWVVIDSFGAIEGWTLPEVAFLYGLRLTAHAVHLVPFNQVFNTDGVLIQGEFDRYLVRPFSPLLQLMTRRFALTCLGDLAGGVVLLVAASTLVDVDWSAVAIGYLVLAVLGGALVSAAVQIFASALAFRFLSTRSLRFLLDQVFLLAGGYPMKVFPAALRFGLTFVVPLAFVAYLPATVLLDRSAELSVQPWLARAAPAVGLLLFVAAWRFWKAQTKHYSSSGH